LALRWLAGESALQNDEPIGGSPHRAIHPPSAASFLGCMDHSAIADDIVRFGAAWSKGYIVLPV
jgi:hypothetical protein